MTKCSLIMLIACACLLSACLTGNSKRHDGFESISDCFVYEYEVKSERHSFGLVESIDTANASGCVKKHLQKTYLLHLNHSIVVVNGTHPKNTIVEIKKQCIAYLSDSTKVTGFKTHKSGYAVTVGRLCSDTNHIRHNTYVDWKFVEFEKNNEIFRESGEEVVTIWYDWNNQAKTSTASDN